MAVDQSAWDGDAAMKACSSAADYNEICAGKRAGDPAERQSHALPHHYLGKAGPNADGVTAALRMIGRTQGLINKADAQSHLEDHMKTIQASENKSRPPRDDLVRDMPRGSIELRSSAEGDGTTMFGHFAVFDSWAEINSVFEGQFLERIAPEAFDQTFERNRSAMKVTFNHGQDPELGDKVLGTIDVLKRDDVGAYYEVSMFPGIPPLLRSGLENGAYGASFRFRVLQEDFNQDPGRSDHNPDGLPERTIRKAEVSEFGPVTFPAYVDATAGVRSGTDELIAWQLTRGEGLKKLAAIAAELKAEERTGDEGGDSPASPEDSAAGETAPAERQTTTDIRPDPRQTDYVNAPEVVPERLCPNCGATNDAYVQTCVNCAQPMPMDMAPVHPTSQEASASMNDIDQFRSVEECESRLAEVKARIGSVDSEWRGRVFDPETQALWDDLKAERTALESKIHHLKERADYVSRVGAQEPNREPAVQSFSDTVRTVQTTKSRIPDDIYDLGAYRTEARGLEDHAQLIRDGARKSVELTEFPMPRGANTDEAGAKAHVERLLKTVDGMNNDLARRILMTGSPVYRRAFNSYLAGKPLTTEEQNLMVETERALSVGTGSAGGFAIVYSLDPTVVPTSNFSVNPYRQIARIETIAGTNEWKAVTSGAITAAYAAEATEASDNAPTLAQPDIIVEKAQAYVPFSIEVGQDWGALDNEMASLLQDAKDDLEATKFALGAGHGSTEPKGIITAATNTVGTTTTQTFVIADLYKLFEALPPRFRPRAQFVANLFTYDKIRQFDTAGGSGVWVDGHTTASDLRGLGPGVGGGAVGSVGLPNVPMLLGRNAWESTAMASALTTTSKILLVGDFRYMVIVDRVGMNIEVVPLVVGTNHRPTGQRGLYAYWRNSSDVLSAAAFEVLVT